MMLIIVHGCYLIDRHFSFRRVQMRFPCRHTNEKGGSERMHHFTLLDGEMVIDTLPDKKRERRYLVYDMMAIYHNSLVERMGPNHQHIMVRLLSECSWNKEEDVWICMRVSEQSDPQMNSALTRRTTSPKMCC